MADMSDAAYGVCIVSRWVGGGLVMGTVGAVLGGS